MNKAFGKQKFVCSYERFFTEKNFMRFCNCAEIPYIPADFHSRYGEELKKTTHTAADYDPFCHRCRDQYDLAKELFGKEKIKKLWGG